MLIDVTTFTLSADADRAALLEADQRLQAELSSCTGFLRRTTAHSETGWIVITLWADAATADAAAARVAQHDAATNLHALIVDVEARRYDALD